MEQTNKSTTASFIKEVKRKAYHRFSTEEKIKAVMMGLRGEAKPAEICRQIGIADSLYYKWTKDFMEAGKRRLEGDTMREANTSEVKELKAENDELKRLVANQALNIQVLKKNLDGSM